MRIHHKRLLLVFAFTGLLISNSKAQDDRPGKESDREYEQFYLGFGAGLDFGGLGMKAEFLPAEWLGVFVGGGYNLVEPAFNVGASAKILPGKHVTPTLLFMYGYNAAIKIKNGFSNADVFRKSYYGFTTGAGIDLQAGRYNNNKVCFALLVPFRTSQFHHDYDGFEEASYEFNPKAIPIAFTVGYQFSLSRKIARK